MHAHNKNRSLMQVHWGYPGSDQAKTPEGLGSYQYQSVSLGQGGANSFGLQSYRSASLKSNLQAQENVQQKGHRKDSLSQTICEHRNPISGKMQAKQTARSISQQLRPRHDLQISKNRPHIQQKPRSPYKPDLNNFTNTSAEPRSRANKIQGGASGQLRYYLAKSHSKQLQFYRECFQHIMVQNSCLTKQVLLKQLELNKLKVDLTRMKSPGLSQPQPRRLQTDMFANMEVIVSAASEDECSLTHQGLMLEEPLEYSINIEGRSSTSITPEKLRSIDLLISEIEQQESNMKRAQRQTSIENGMLHRDSSQEQFSFEAQPQKQLRVFQQLGEVKVPQGPASTVATAGSRLQRLRLKKGLACRNKSNNQ